MKIKKRSHAGNDLMYQKQLQHEHDHAAGHGGFEQVRAEIGGDHAHRHGGNAAPGALGGVHDGREGHHRQRHIGHIIKEGADKTAPDGAAHQGQGQSPDRIDDQEHDQDIDIIVMIHLPPPLVHHRPETGQLPAQPAAG